jgi:uncharacterized protein DUF6188
MYGLPPDLDLEFFDGKTLLQVCVGAHDLILNFDDGLSVTVTSSVGCADSSGSIQRYGDFCQAAPAVLVLVNRVVLSARDEGAGTLALRFDGGGALYVYDDSQHYESYTINNSGAPVIVV